MTDMFLPNCTTMTPPIKPDDFSDVGQAEVLAKRFPGELRYSLATHYIRYNGRCWQETEPGAQAVAHELPRRQMKEASADMLSALAALKTCGAQNMPDNNSKAKAEGMMSEEQIGGILDEIQSTSLPDPCPRLHRSHPIATVFLDMGLGKTNITLTAINDLMSDSFEVHRVLVIAPLRVARDTWTAEVKWSV